MNVILFAVTVAAMVPLHQVGDHWVQTHRQAVTKTLEGATGQRACAAHVATYTATLAGGLLLVLSHVPVLELNWGTFLLGLAVNAVSHYIADRRWPLRSLAVALGKRDYWDNVPGGSYQLDQSWHWGWLGISALIIAW